MSFRILPQEFHLQSSRDGGHVRTRVPKEYLDDGTILLNGVRLNQLEAGSSIIVQVTTHDYGRLLHECEFRVTRAETITVRDDEERTSQKTIYEIARKTAWWDAPTPATEAVQPHMAAAPEIYVQDAASVRWNFGQKCHEVVIGDKVVFATTDKQLAAAIARGDTPIPQTADAL